MRSPRVKVTSQIASKKMDSTNRSLEARQGLDPGDPTRVGALKNRVMGPTIPNASTWYEVLDRIRSCCETLGKYPVLREECYALAQLIVEEFFQLSRSGSRLKRISITRHGEDRLAGSLKQRKILALIQNVNPTDLLSALAINSVVLSLVSSELDGDSLVEIEKAAEAMRQALSISRGARTLDAAEKESLRELIVAADSKDGLAQEFAHLIKAEGSHSSIKRFLRALGSALNESDSISSDDSSANFTGASIEIVGRSSSDHSHFQLKIYRENRLGEVNDLPAIEEVSVSEVNCTVLPALSYMGEDFESENWFSAYLDAVHYAWISATKGKTTMSNGQLVPAQIEAIFDAVSHWHDWLIDNEVDVLEDLPEALIASLVVALCLILGREVEAVLAVTFGGAGEITDKGRWRRKVHQPENAYRPDIALASQYASSVEVLELSLPQPLRNLIVALIERGICGNFLQRHMASQKTTANKLVKKYLRDIADEKSFPVIGVNRLAHQMRDFLKGSGWGDSEIFWATGSIGHGAPVSNYYLSISTETLSRNYLDSSTKFCRGEFV